MLVRRCICGQDKFLLALHGSIELLSFILLASVEFARSDVECLRPLLESTKLCRCGADGAAKCYELTAHLSSTTSGCSFGAFATFCRQCEFEGGTILGKALLALHELFLFGSQRKDLAIDIGEFMTELANLTAQRCDNITIDCRLSLTHNASEALVDEVLGTVGSLAEAFEPCECIAKVNGSLCRQVAFEADDVDIERGEQCAKFTILGTEVTPVLGVGIHLLAQGLDLAPGQPYLASVQLGDNIAVTTSGVGLLFQRTKLAANLAEEILNASEVCFGGDEAALCLLAALAELQNSGSLFDDETTILGASIEHRIDLALTDDHVLGSTNARVRQHLLDIEQTTRHAVERVFAVARTK